MDQATLVELVSELLRVRLALEVARRSEENVRRLQADEAKLRTRLRQGSSRQLAASEGASAAAGAAVGVGAGAGDDRLRSTLLATVLRALRKMPNMPSDDGGGSAAGRDTDLASMVGLLRTLVDAKALLDRVLRDAATIAVQRARAQLLEAAKRANAKCLLPLLSTAPVAGQGASETVTSKKKTTKRERGGGDDVRRTLKYP